MCVTSFEVARLKGSLSCALNPLRARTPSCAHNPSLAISLSLSLSLSLSSSLSLALSLSLSLSLSLCASALFREHTQVQVALLALHLIKVLPKHFKYVKNTEYIYTTKVIKEIINEYKIRERKNSWQYL